LIYDLRNYFTLPDYVVQAGIYENLSGRRKPVGRRPGRLKKGKAKGNTIYENKAVGSRQNLLGRRVPVRWRPDRLKKQR